MENDVTKWYSIELNRILQYMTTELLEEYPTVSINAEYFLLSVLINKNSLAYKLIDSCIISVNIEAIIKTCHENLSKQSMMVIKPTRKVKFNDELRELLNESENQMRKFNDSLITSEHVLMSMLCKGVTTRDILEKYGIDYNMAFHKMKNNREFNDDVTKNIEHNNNIKKDFKILPNKDVFKSNKQGFIEKYTINLSHLSETKKIDKIVGRTSEISQIFNILGRRKKNNVVLVGDGGVGKTSIVKYLATMIHERKVPERFLGKQLIQLDMTSIIAGTNFRGMFEERIKGLIDEAKKNKNYILFIDDIHSILAEKNQTGDVNMISMLSSALSDGDIQFIGCTNFKDCKNNIDGNPSIGRKFQKVIINPTSTDETINILNECKEYYEKHHDVSYTDDAILDSVKLSNRYITDRNLPDSAIDTLDEAGSYARNNIEKPNEITELEEYITELNDLKYESIKLDDYDTVDQIDMKIRQLKIRLAELEKEFKKKISIVITDNMIKELIAQKTNIPVENVTYSEKKKLLTINDNIKKHVIGQDEAIDKVCDVIKRNRIGLGDTNKPMVLFFEGRTGTGKTLLAKKIAELIYGDEKYLVKLDMSEYSDKMAVNKLVGSSPGYVGYEQGGALCNIIRNKKYCVLLLDEIEKATNEVHNMFLQVFDDGKLTDNMGVTIDFKNVIIIMTSNIGAKKSIDFGNGIGLRINNPNDKQKDIIEKELKNAFSPEFINRISEIIYFNSLNDKNIKDIIKLEIDKLNDKLGLMGYSISKDFYSSEYIDHLFNNVKEFDKYGARTVFKVIRDMIEKPITDLILKNEYDNGHKFTIINDNDEMVII